MSYSKLELLEIEIQKNVQYIKKTRVLIEKIQNEALNRRKNISNISLEMEKVKEQLILDNILVGDIFVTNTGYSNNIRRGDTIKVIRVNKKSVTIEVMEIGITWLKYERETNRIGRNIRCNKERLNRLIFNTMITSIKRNEKLKKILC